MAVDGFGGTGFSAKEVVLDLLLTPLMPRCTDLDTWCPVGPGACRGLNRLAGRPVQEMPTTGQLMSELLGVFRALDKYYPSPLAEEKQLGLHDIQFQLCEFDKYLRAKHGQGRLRRFMPHFLRCPSPGSAKSHSC
uniref:5-hmdU DNA kinase helical domain-containing protein n=1 Tax=Pyrodinium bahamense TaxID=73915 RepID=A0A7S0B397_9DINO